MQTETTVFNLFFMPSCLAGAHSNNEKASFCLIYPNDSFHYLSHISQNTVTCICSFEIKASPIEAFTPQFPYTCNATCIYHT